MRTLRPCRIISPTWAGIASSFDLQNSIATGCAGAGRHGKHLLNLWALDIRDEAVRWGTRNDSRNHRRSRGPRVGYSVRNVSHGDNDRRRHHHDSRSRWIDPER
jgi:hypothetical protein